MSTEQPEDDSMLLLYQDYWDDIRNEEFVRRLPKVELHVHLDGSFDPNILWNYLQQHPELLQCFPVETNTFGQQQPCRSCVAQCQSASEYRRLTSTMIRRRKTKQPANHNTSNGGPTPPDEATHDSHQVPHTIPTLADMLMCFEFFLPLVYHAASSELLEELAYDFGQRQAAQNIVYTEVRYAPHLLHPEPKVAVEAVTKGLRRACSGNIILNQILCAINYLPQQTPQVVALAQEYQTQFPCAVVGIDVAAGEDHFDTNAHLSCLNDAKDIPLTIHAGEVPLRGAQHVQTAMEQYGARRIGHGYQIVTSDPENLQMLRDLKKKYPYIHFETCLDSSVQTGGWIKAPKPTSNTTTSTTTTTTTKSAWLDHPVNTFRREGISVSLNSDDPAVFNTSLTWQWRIALQKMKWTRDDCRTVLEDTIDASFGPPDQQRELHQRVAAFFEHDTPMSSSKSSTPFTDRVEYEEE